MPQMMPMYWIITLYLSFITFFSTIFFIYFIYWNTPIYSLSSNFKLNNWLWMW